MVSLPSGCFNPYSGVKTSILILDKSLARQSDTIAFFKVENDGFGLGAQRRAIEKNDLPQVQDEITAYLKALRSRSSDWRDERDQSDLSDRTDLLNGSVGSVGSDRSVQLIVPKEKIAANGDYNLSGERYREDGVKTNIFPLVKLREVCTVNPRKSQLTGKPEMRVSFVPMADLNEHRISFQPCDEKQLSDVSASYTYFENNDVLLAKVTPCFENGKAGIARGLINGIGFGSSEFYVLRSNGQVLPEWVYFCVMHPRFRDAAVAQMTGTGGLQRVPRDYVENFQIPLPPLDVQKEIVAEIEGYQKVINGARGVLDNYRPHIPIDPDWPMGLLADVCTLISGQHIDKDDYNTDRVGVDYLTGPSDFGLKHPIATRWTVKPKVFAAKGDILMTVKGSGLGSINLLNTERAAISRQLMAIRVRDADPEFIYVFLLAKFDHIQSLGGGAAIPGITRTHVLGLQIPLPPLSTQQAIVAEIEAEQALVEANRELITRFEKKIQITLARIWGEETPTFADV